MKGKAAVHITAAAAVHMKIGAQMYTVRDFCKSISDLEESLKKIADIGYRSVQLSGVCAYDPDRMAAFLTAHGLTADITHFDYHRIVTDTAAVIAHHDKLGCRYIGIGSNPYGATPEGLEKLARELKPCLPEIIASSHRFMYHNHNSEFARFNGVTFLELLCETFTPRECGITFDTYWAQAAGIDPAHAIRSYRDRVACIHLKDMLYSPEDKNVRMAEVGSGNMNYPAILAAAVDSGVEFAFVEQDNCYGTDPFDCLKSSFSYLRAQGLC